MTSNKTSPSTTWSPPMYDINFIVTYLSIATSKGYLADMEAINRDVKLEPTFLDDYLAWGMKS